MWHIDSRCEQALIKLNDALCSWERNTNRQYTLILIPLSPDERIVVSENGKPLPEDHLATPEETFAIAMKRRRIAESEFKK